MKINLIFIDIDGTLLNSHMKIDDETKYCLLDFQKAGGKVVLSSARPYIGMKNYGDELKLDKYGGYYSSFNGGQIVEASTGKTIHKQGFQKGDIKKISDLILKLEEESQQRAMKKLGSIPQHGVSITMDEAKAVHQAIEKNCLNLMTYKDDTLLTLRFEMYAVIETLLNTMTMQVNSDFLDAAEFEPAKVLVSGDPSVINDVYPEIKQNLELLFEVVTSDPFFIEITPKGIDKGTSMNVLLNILNLDSDKVAAFGDSENDIPMLKRAGIGIAMGNASELIRKSADMVTLSNDENGIAFALKKLV